ncbi:hypothetical protein, partial [Calditerricola satsumensis]|uniref:hypothetical protein n=1 Tax=Calditerricola satsumensis TaxID=373054 RepID=UPI001C460FF5
MCATERRRGERRRSGLNQNGTVWEPVPFFRLPVRIGQVAVPIGVFGAVAKVVRRLRSTLPPL